jgi:hypothetical protein
LILTWQSGQRISEFSEGDPMRVLPRFVNQFAMF